VLVRIALAAAALVAAGPPEDSGPSEAEGDRLWARAGLQLRFTAEGAIPNDMVLFDAATNSFAANQFLAAQAPDRYLSGLFFASSGLAAASWLDFRLDVDSGLVRSEQLPLSTQVCYSTRTQSGVVVASPGACPATGALSTFSGSLPATKLGAPQLTSNGQAIADEFDSSLFIRQLYADVTAGPAAYFRARVGRQRLRVADGIVYDDWGLGVNLDADIGSVGPPLSANLSVFLPTRYWPSPSQWQSPVVAFTFDWLPALGDWVGLWMAYSHDSTGDANQVLREGFIATEVERLLAYAPGSATYIRSSRSLALLVASPPIGTSDLGWAGLSGRVHVGDRNEARFTVGASFGTVSSFGSGVAALPQAVEVPALGWEVSLRWLSLLGSGFRLTPFFLWLSGDDPAQEQQAALGIPRRHSGFLSISPFITTTNLFFQGGISEAYADRQLASSGVNARGVITPGLEAGWTPTSTVEVVGKGAFLWSDTSGPFGGRVYGPELDLSASWDAFPWLAVLGELDFLDEGNFFPQRALSRRLIVGIDLTTP
jgi:hypothetical protein